MEQQQHQCPSGFLGLPTEVRLLIYGYIWEHEVYAIDWLPAQGVLGSKVLSLPEELQNGTSRDTNERRREVSWKIQNQSDYVDDSNGHPPRTQDFLFTRAALLLTCRRIYEEAKDVFYANAILRFPDDEVLQCLLSTLSPTSKASIRSLELMYYSPADPPEFADCGPRYPTPWYIDEEKHREAWENAITRVVDELTGLTSLTLFLYFGWFGDCLPMICHRRPDRQAGLNEKWAHPLMVFKKCPLVSLNVNSSCHLIGNILLQELLEPERGSSKIVRVQHSEWTGELGYLEWITHGTTAT